METKIVYITEKMVERFNNGQKTLGHCPIPAGKFCRKAIVSNGRIVAVFKKGL